MKVYFLQKILKNLSIFFTEMGKPEISSAGCHQGNRKADISSSQHPRASDRGPGTPGYPLRLLLNGQLQIRI